MSILKFYMFYGHIKIILKSLSQLILWAVLFMILDFVYLYILLDVQK